MNTKGKLKLALGTATDYVAPNFIEKHTNTAPLIPRLVKQAGLSVLFNEQTRTDDIRWLMCICAN